MAWLAHYGHVPPSESLAWEIADLNDFSKELDQIVRDANKTTKGRGR